MVGVELIDYTDDGLYFPDSAADNVTGKPRLCFF